jgi:hypothetical protein
MPLTKNNYKLINQILCLCGPLLIPIFADAEMTPFGEKVDTKSTSEISPSSIPSFPSIAPSPAPTSAPQPQASPTPSLNPASTQKESAVTVAKKPSPSKPQDRN